MNCFGLANLAMVAVEGELTLLIFKTTLKPIVNYRRSCKYNLSTCIVNKTYFFNILHGIAATKHI